VTGPGIDCDVIILAGGRGTRLQGVLPADIPKPLASVAGQPFLHWLIAQLAGHSARRIILSVGWKAEKIREVFGNSHLGVKISYCEEQQPLGTGGAIRAALELAESPSALVMNGDTFLDADMPSLLRAHEQRQSKLTMSCTRVADASRFGRLKIENETVQGFEEKGVPGPGYINAGVYAMRRDLLAECNESFSFEKDFLEPSVSSLRPFAFEVSGLFIDIGVPADLLKAQTLFPRS
jgi:D-glycero-alpha-D-manno-heptose 1-phosphate guanylyltransferase